MSWIFGYYGNVSNRKINSPEAPHHSFKDSNLILFVGGNKQTSFLKSNQLISCWAVTGVGLVSSESNYKLLDENNWNNLLSSTKVDLSPVNGHFVVVKYSDGELNFFTDELGLREIYIVKLSDGYGFTTRIDWLKYFINPEIDLKEFGSRWLLQNQISKNSIIKNVNRIVCANATIENGILIVEENYWKPDYGVQRGKELFDNIINKFLSVEGKKISLSLSGGLDSRLLLSYLFKKNPKMWETHTFGDPNHPDSKIAYELLNSANFRNKIINENLPLKDEFIEQLNRYAIRNIVSSQVSSILNLRFYDQIADDYKIIIDGGFGEMWRREFANKFLIFGRKALLSKDVRKTFKLFSHSKVDIFSDDVLNELEIGSFIQIEQLFKDLPDAESIRLENWLDLLTIRARLLNTSAPEQARVDDYVVSFMPFIQKDILKILFSLSIWDRKNGKLFRDIINRNAFALTNYPLVKGAIIYSYGLSSLSARVYSKLKMKTRLYYKDHRKNELMLLIKDYILDLAYSQPVKNCDLYDPRKIKKMADDFSAMESGYNSEIDWFLSFELFRQGISK